ncbi:hypothetical protein JHFBIEKO_4420 [Methylobacterium mesophilicum]|uniref:helix-turn-helix domain-containing protein n=1 Tax=Methylobacterium mesophilicum TaxID=39956 RepID=UPI001EE2BD39|nr:helix-turn-helix domain-containing protein [Methylobacterium mesophilicum]GJE23954.1 hypothetical protein JHFBIEKO_4420 [Methylobacterium mesophilicum]
MSKHEKSQVRVPAKAGQKLEWLDVLFEDEALSQAAKNVAWRLVRHHNDLSGQCNPMQATLAKGIGRSTRIVSDAVRELKDAGWIEVNKHRDGADYVLILDRAEAVEAGEIRDQSRFRHARYIASAARSIACQVRDQSRIEPLTLTTEGTTNPTTAPAAVAIEPEVVGPAMAKATIPDQPKASLSTPANDDARQRGGQTFAGWTIPSETIQGWVAGFTYMDVPAQLVSSAPWFAKNVPEKGRTQKLESRLRKLNAEAREAHLGREKAKAADTEAGVTRDFTGRAWATPKLGWVENPGALPPGASRHQMHDPVAKRITFRGKGWHITVEGLKKMKEFWPDVDLHAEISAFDRDHASTERTNDENKIALAEILDQRQAEAKAA